MGQISNLPPFVSIQVPSGTPTVYGDTVETGTGGEFYYQVGGIETRLVHGPIPKLGPIPMHDVFIPNPAESLSSVSGRWTGVSRDINIVDIDKKVGLKASIQRDAVTRELMVAIDNSSDKATHRILVPLRVDGSNMDASQLDNPALLAALGQSPINSVSVSVHGGLACVTLRDASGNGNIYSLSNQASSVSPTGTDIDGIVNMKG